MNQESSAFCNFVSWRMAILTGYASTHRHIKYLYAHRCIVSRGNMRRLRFTHVYAHMHICVHTYTHEIFITSTEAFTTTQSNDK